MPKKNEAAANPGWYGDPFGQHQRRFWDGTQWTSQVRDSGGETNDPPSSVTVSSVSATSAEGESEKVYRIRRGQGRESVAVGVVTVCFALIVGIAFLPVSLHQGGVNGGYVAIQCVLLLVVAPYGAWRTWKLIRNPPRVCVTPLGLTAYNVNTPAEHVDADDIRSLTLETMHYPRSQVPMSTPRVTRQDGTGFWLDALGARRASAPTIESQEETIREIRATLNIPS